MVENALAKKLKLKPHSRAAVIGAPEGYLRELEPLPDGVQLGDKLQGKFDWIQLFVKNQAEINNLAPRAFKALKPESILWISFPKGTSNLQTDLTRDRGWEVLKGANLKWLTLISVNTTWSAFALRPYKKGEPRRDGRL